MMKTVLSIEIVELQRYFGEMKCGSYLYKERKLQSLRTVGSL